MDSRLRRFSHMASSVSGQRRRKHSSGGSVIEYCLFNVLHTRWKMKITDISPGLPCLPILNPRVGSSWPFQTQPSIIPASADSGGWLFDEVTSGRLRQARDFRPSLKDPRNTNISSAVVPNKFGSAQAVDSDTGVTNRPAVS